MKTIEVLKFCTYLKTKNIIIPEAIISNYLIGEFCTTSDVIIDIVCRFFKIDYLSLIDRCKKSDFVQPRQLCCYFLKYYSSLSLNQIAEKVGYKDDDHASVLHSIKVVKNYCDTDKYYKDKFDKLEKLIK
jgi:chromosomal replication initiation ATPase DnaA